MRNVKLTDRFSVQVWIPSEQRWREEFNYEKKIHATNAKKRLERDGWEVRVIESEPATYSVKVLSQNPEPRWAKYAIVYQGRQQLFRSRAEAVEAATRIRSKGIEVQIMAIRERVKNPRKSRREEIQSRLNQSKSIMGEPHPIWIVETSKNGKQWAFFKAHLGPQSAENNVLRLAADHPELFIRARQVMTAD